MILCLLWLMLHFMFHTDVAFLSQVYWITWMVMIEANVIQKWLKCDLTGSPWSWYWIWDWSDFILLDKSFQCCIVWNTRSWSFIIQSDRQTNIDLKIYIVSTWCVFQIVKLYRLGKNTSERIWTWKNHHCNKGLYV